MSTGTVGHEVPGVWSGLGCEMLGDISSYRATLQSEGKQSIHSLTHSLSKASVHRPRGTYLWDTFLLDRELSNWAECGNLPSWLKKQQAFSLQTYWYPWVSFYRFSTEDTTFRRKTDNFAYFSHLYVNSEETCVIVSVMCLYQPFRLANLNKGRVCVTPVGDSLRMRLLPGFRYAKYALFTWQRFLAIFQGKSS